MKPSTIIAVLALQLYFGHKRKDDKTAKMIQVIEDNESVQYGYNSNIMEIGSEYKIDSKTWSDEIAEVLLSRELKIENNSYKQTIETQNRSIMDFAISYVKEGKLNPKIIAPINHVRQFKKMFLPCELVGLRGNVKTYQFTSLEAISCLKWNIAFPQMPRPSKKSFQIWSEFIEWIFQ